MKSRNYAFDIAEALKEYSKEYNCTLFQSAMDMDYPVTVSVYREAFILLNESITEQELNKIGTSELDVNEYWRAENQD